MLGETLAIVAALVWAASTILSAEALRKVDPIRSNPIKTLFSTLLMFPIAFAFGEMSHLYEVKIQGLLLVILAALIGYGIGDTLLLKSNTLIGISRAYTLASAYPYLRWLLRFSFLENPFPQCT